MEGLYLMDTQQVFDGEFKVKSKRAAVPPSQTVPAMV
jgi:hypothetical protein